MTINEDIKYNNIPIINRILDNKAVDVKVINFNPENLENSGIEAINAINQMQKTRLERKFSGKNF